MALGGGISRGGVQFFRGGIRVGAKGQPSAKDMLLNVDGTTGVVNVFGASNAVANSGVRLSTGSGVNASARDWGFITNNSVFGDLELWVGSAVNGSPFSGTNIVNWTSAGMQPQTATLFPNGALGTPSISFASQPTLGFFRVTTDQLGVSFSGSKSVLIYSGGVLVPSTGSIGFVNTGDATTGTADCFFSRTADGAISFTGSANTTPRIQLGGTTSAFPALKRNGVNLEARLADDSAGTGLVVIGGTQFLTTSSALTNTAAANTATFTNAPVAGNPTKWIQINDNGTLRSIPAF